MTDYRRIYVPGSTWFFTANLAERRGSSLLVDHIDDLRAVLRRVKGAHPFRIDAMVVLPEHLHCLWTLADETADYSTPWRLIKGGFSRGLPKNESISASRGKRRERGIWQRRFWAHFITDQNDYNRHFDYIHWNPVKHGWVTQVQDWPYSSFHRYVTLGVYPLDWGGCGDIDINTGEPD